VKTIGIVGGIGPESTIDYYRSLVALCRERAGPDHYPPIIINSINVARMLGLIGAGQLVETIEYLVAAVKVLADAGAELGLLASNTPHIVFDDIASQSPMPLISIVRATCDAARAMGLTRLGLIGTRFTMEAGFYQKCFASEGSTVLVPEEADRNVVHERYMRELVQGVYLDETRAAILAVIDRLIDRQGAHGVILGGTELPLLLRADAHRGVPLLNTTRIHVESAVAAMLT
jgi:aspartate racemase